MAGYDNLFPSVEMYLVSQLRLNGDSWIVWGVKTSATYACTGSVFCVAGAYHGGTLALRIYFQVLSQSEW